VKGDIAPVISSLLMAVVNYYRYKGDDEKAEHLINTLEEIAEFFTLEGEA